MQRDPEHTLGDSHLTTVRRRRNQGSLGGPWPGPSLGAIQLQNKIESLSLLIREQSVRDMTPAVIQPEKREVPLAGFPPNVESSGVLGDSVNIQKIKIHIYLVYVYRQS